MGIAITYALILLTQSTFTIWGFAKIPLSGGGTIEPSDIFLLYIFFRYYFLSDGLKTLDKVDLASVLIAFWIVISFFLNYAFGEVPLALFFSKPVRLALLWLCFPAMRRMNAKSTKVLVLSALAISFATMLVHIYIQLTDQRTLMPLMYYSLDVEGFSYRGYQLQHDDFIRLTPSGQLLSGAVFASSLVVYFTNLSSKFKMCFVPISLAIGLGLIVNITRSTLISTILISPLLVFFNLGKLDARNSIRLGIIFCCALFFIFSVSIVMPGIVEKYAERFSQIDDTINSSSNNPRISDNTSAVEEIAERPVIGNGFPSLRNFTTDSGGDVNSYLMVCLQGGIPLLLLFFNFLARVWKWRFSNSDTYQLLALVGFCYIVIMWCLVLPGANGPHTMRELTPFLLFSSVLCRKIAVPAVWSARHES